MDPLNNFQDHYYVSADWLVDGSGGAILTNVLLEISGGIIISMGKAESIERKRHNVFDFSNCTILPGLVDSHVHLAMSGTDNPEKRQGQRNATFKEAKAVISKHLRDHFKYGVVALRDGGDHFGHTLRYKSESLDRGSLPISCAVAGKAWHAQGRYGDFIGRPPYEGEGLAQSLLRKSHGINHIKIVNSGLNSLSSYSKETNPQFSLEDLIEAVRVGERLGLRIMVHANGKRAVKEALDAGCHSIEHGFFMGDDNLRRMADKQVTWVPTLFTMKALSKGIRSVCGEIDVAKRNLDHQLEQVAKAVKYGVIIAAGTDSGSPGVNHGEAIIEEIRMIVSAGLTIEQAVRCVTFNGARVIGDQYNGGMLKPRMPATFIVTRGSPEKLPGSLSPHKAVFVQGRAWRIESR